MQKNKILRSEYPDQFDEFVDDEIDISYQEHRRSSNFWTKTIHEITENSFPDMPELWGNWETNVYISDSEYGTDKSEIYELKRVELKTEIKTITVKSWVEIN